VESPRRTRRLKKPDAQPDVLVEPRRKHLTRPLMMPEKLRMSNAENAARGKRKRRKLADKKRRKLDALPGVSRKLLRRLNDKLPRQKLRSEQSDIVQSGLKGMPEKPPIPMVSRSPKAQSALGDPIAASLTWTALLMKTRNVVVDVKNERLRVELILPKLAAASRLQSWTATSILEMAAKRVRRSR